MLLCFASKAAMHTEARPHPAPKHDAWLANRRQWTTEWVLPTTPQRLVDRQRSRAYVGQFSADGELFYGASLLPASLWSLPGSMWRDWVPALLSELEPQRPAFRAAAAASTGGKGDVVSAA